MHQELIILEKMKNVETRIAFLKNYGKNEFRLVPKALETRNERHFSVIMALFEVRRVQRAIRAEVIHRSPHTG